MTDFFTHQLVILLPGTKNGFVAPNVSLTGDSNTDRALLANYISGVPVAMKGDLTIGIADGATDQVVGLLVYDAAGTSPLDGIGGADQSGVLTYVYGLATVRVPSRVLASGTFAVGTKVYAGTGANLGKLTDVASATEQVIGTILSSVDKANDGLIVQMAL